MPSRTGWSASPPTLVLRRGPGRPGRRGQGVRLAHRGRGVANTVEPRFAIASSTMGLTALTVVVLIEDGRLARTRPPGSEGGGDGLPGGGTQMGGDLDGRLAGPRRRGGRHPVRRGLCAPLHPVPPAPPRT